jgi:TRAP-type C4-dicarboxylate transport system substrate-binding protein
MKAKILLLFLAILLTVPLVAFGACKAAAPGEAIVLKYVSFRPDRYPDNAFERLFIDKVNKRAKGELVIEHRGGPEVIAPTDIPKAVVSGAVDMAYCLGSLTDVISPGDRCLSLQEITPTELRARRAKGVDLLQELHRKAGVYYLGGNTLSVPSEGPVNSFLMLYGNKRVEKLGDFAGMKLAAPSPGQLPFFKALGATLMVMGLQDQFSAVQSGVVDGYLTSAECVVSYGLLEVTKYVYDYAYAGGPGVFIVNLGVWDKLSEHLQSIMQKAAIETEEEYILTYNKEIYDPARKKMREAGMEFLKLPPDDAKKFFELYKETIWAAEMKAHPDVAPEIKKLITK